MTVRYVERVHFQQIVWPMYSSAIGKIEVKRWCNFTMNCCMLIRINILLCILILTISITNKKFSCRWQTARRVYRSVEVTNHDTIPYVRYGFLLVSFSNLVRKDIRLQKCRNLENRVKGPWRSLKMAPFDRVHMTSYCSIVNMAISLVVTEIFNVDRYRDLEITVRCQSRSL